MRGSERPDPMCGPLENMSQAYFAGIDRMAKTYEPALNGLSRYNLELAGLAARRARAWFEIPATLGRCKTPQDVLGEQARFWQTAMAQYTQSWQHLSAVAGSFAIVPGINGALGGQMAAPARDFITFPEATGSNGEDEQPRTDRRAA
jgi:Phasin protein